MAETSKPPTALAAVLATISVLAFCGAMLAIWRPWYTRAEAARLDQLRNDIAGLKGKSIARYLEERPAERLQPLFYKPPVEYWAFDLFMRGFAIAGMLWLFAMVPVGLKLSLQFDKARAERQRLEAIERQRWEASERQRLEAVEMANAAEISDADVIAPDKLNCAYCGRAIIANGVAIGQALHCPNCGADVRVPRV